MTNNLLFGDIKMPAIGYGTWQALDDDLEKALEAALEAGYRHIDTAHVYQNEHVIGKVLQRWISSGKLKREDLFIVTKLPPRGNRPAGVQKYIRSSLEALQVDYVDVYLIHTPFGVKEVEGEQFPLKDGKLDLDVGTNHVETWKEMEKLVDQGLAKAIGISNFNIRQIQRILDNARIRPANLQVELHVYHQQKELVDFCRKNNIVVTAYAPIGSPGLPIVLQQRGITLTIPSVLEDPTVKEIAKKHNKTTAQVLLRFLIQKGITVIPKSVNPERLRQNINIFDFVLDGDDLQKLQGLDRGDCGRFFDFKSFSGIENHPEYPFKK